MHTAGLLSRGFYDQAPIKRSPLTRRLALRGLQPHTACELCPIFLPILAPDVPGRWLQ